MTDLIEPLDEYNRKLIENVHPPDWVNPEPKERYHMVVIGAGTAGLVSAKGAAGLGAKVALIERHLMGGDCLNVGCVPSKGVIRAARAWQDARKAAERFAGPEVAPERPATSERPWRACAACAPTSATSTVRRVPARWE